MYAIAITLHIVVCLMVILVVLIQSGKGAGLSNVFGASSGDAVFSAPSGSMFIRKITTGLAIGFFLTSLALTYISARQGLRTVTRNAWQQQMPAQQPAPAEMPTTPAENPPAAK